MLKEFKKGETYTFEEIMIEQFKILHDEARKEETTASEKVELSNAMVSVYNSLRGF